MLILALHGGRHDSAAALYDNYKLIGAIHRERLTRRKTDGRGLSWEAADEMCRIANVTRRDVDTVVLTREILPTNYYRPRYARNLSWFRRQRLKLYRSLGTPHDKSLWGLMQQWNVAHASELFDGPRLLRDKGFRPDAKVHYCNHHMAHALPALFFTDWDDAFLYTADGSGDGVCYSFRWFKDGRLTDIYGEEKALDDQPSYRRVDSLGLAYGFCTLALGFKINRHEGKLTGLAATGSPTLFDDMARHFTVDADGQVLSDFTSVEQMKQRMFALAKDEPRENVAASVQRLLEETILDSVTKLIKRYPARHLGLAGGVFANVTLNRRLAETLDLDEVFIVPPMGDDGLPLGAVLQYLLERDGMETWLDNRYRLTDVYLGRNYDAEVDKVLRQTPSIGLVSESPVQESAHRLSRGEVGAIYTGRMEYGPRALGARSILASPVDRDINDKLNARLSRTEFMPFAPVVTDEDASEVFEITSVNRYAARFMTITCLIRPEWRDKIPGVVHVDGTARPQVIERGPNPLYFDILTAFNARTGIPALVNTSFNVHEEPIVNTPKECAKALNDGRIDFVITAGGVYVKK